MAVIKSQDVLFTLEKISSQSDWECFHNSFEVVLKIKDLKDKKSVQYLSFVFTSFDAMSQHLKSLAKHFFLFSVDNLMKGEYPAIVEYEEHFNSPSSFKAFKLFSNYCWPYNNCHARFLRDEPE